MATQAVKDISQGMKSERFTPTVQKSAAYWRAFLADCGPPPPQYPFDNNGNKNMSGYKLRALLDDADFCSSLVNGGNAQLSLLGNRDDDKKKKLSDGVFDPSSASLFRNNIWDQEGNTDDFNLEYMDLDEFLTETGLVDDQNFANIMSNSRPEAPSNLAQPRAKQTQNVKLSNLEKLLMSGGGDGDNNRVASPSHSEGGVVSVTDATQQILPTTIEKTESTIKDKEDNKPSTGITLTADQIVKKRKYSEDGEGLGETSVVVVPGQEGFDPSAAKFAPEELQPQPIIKKSKKQFVPEDSKDEKYWKRRNKNNVAAKRSREARRAKENQIIMRAGFLESENERLTSENIELQSENSRLQDIIEELRNK